MAEDSGFERTEPASPRRLDEAREKGQVARSRELSTFAVLLAGGGGIWIMGSSLIAQLSSTVKNGLSVDRATAFDIGLMMEQLFSQSSSVLYGFLPLLGLMMIVALAAPLLLNGWLFSTQALHPDFSRLNPLAGLKRIFSVSGLIELSKASAKALLIGAVSIWVMWSYKEAAFALISEPIHSSIAHLGNLLGLGFMIIAGSMIAVVAIDVPFQIWDHGRKLRMSLQEIHQENKETEGDPHVKSRIRALQRDIARRRMMEQLPKADVIITNPTHYAVALQYVSDQMRAPKVIAKGADLVAKRIREVGAELHIPLLEAAPLARALYHHTELGDEIPDALYTAVAEVLAYVFQLRRYKEYGGAEPKAPEDILVPIALDPIKVTP